MAALNLQMLRRKIIRHFNRPLQILHDHNRTEFLQRFFGCFGPRQFHYLLLQLFENAFGKRLRIRDDDSAAIGGVFGLAEHVGGDPRRIGLLVGDDQNLARPGNRIDPAIVAGDSLFRRLDPLIAGADDLIDFTDRLGSRRQSDDSLGAADSVHLGNAQFAADRQDNRVDTALVSRWRDHGDLLHSGDLGWNDRHNHRRRQRRRRPGYADADTPYRCVSYSARGILRIDQDVSLVSPHVFNRLTQTKQNVLIDFLVGSVQFFLAHPEFVRFQFYSVELFRVFRNGLVTTIDNIAKDINDLLVVLAPILDKSRGAGYCRTKTLQFLFKTGTG